MTLAHLQKARDLGRVALLRARLRFAAGETDAAINDVLATLKMARDCGSNPILIGFLVDVAIEKISGEVLAANLPRLKPEQLDQLAGSLKELPPTATLADGMRWESQHFGGWLERLMESEAAKITDPKAGGSLLHAIARSAEDVGFNEALHPKEDDVEGKRRATVLLSLTVGEVRESLQSMRLDYEAVAKIAELPVDQQFKAWVTFEASLAESRHFAKREDAQRFFSSTFLPTAAAFFDREEQLQVRRQLLEQAVHVQRHGASALRPILGKKVDHQKTETGFELRHQYVAPDKIEILIVGATKPTK